eukprot:COSAG05_NODE_3421_length_2077_cov_1.410010_2_plen_151_part_01
MVKGDSNNHWAVKGGDAQAGKLRAMFDGPRPPGYRTTLVVQRLRATRTGCRTANRTGIDFLTYVCIARVSVRCMGQSKATACSYRSRYHPMRKQGAILLGIGGDNSDGATGVSSAATHRSPSACDRPRFPAVCVPVLSLHSLRCFAAHGG